MKGTIFTLMFLGAVCFGQVTLTTSDLPIVVIETEPGDTIKDDPRIVCYMGIIDNASGTNNISDPHNGYTGKISIEIRGSTSQQYPKKSYGLETQDDFGNNLNVSLLGMPAENDWILYAPYPDKTCIRNVLTFDLARKMGNYASRTHYCELVINGEYKGLYVLMEKLKRDANRINVKKIDSTDIAGVDLTGGYIFKVDKTTGSIVDTWNSLYDPEVVFQYHDPKPDKMLPVQKSYLQSYVGDFETAIYGPDFADPTTGYHSIINKLTFYDFMIMQELGRTVDGYRSSSFMFKRRDDIWGGLLNAGPMWDFNLSYGNANYCDADLTTGWQYEFDDICDFSVEIPFFWEKLLQDTNYTNGLRCRWEMLREGPLHTDSIHTFIDDQVAIINAAKERNFDQWPIIGVYVNWNSFVGPTYTSEIDYLKWYIQQRAIWLDNNIPGTCWPGLAETEEIEKPIAMSKVWPNPANDIVYIGFTIPTDGKVNIQIHDISGRLIESMDLGNLQSDHYIKEWYTENIKSGVYTYNILLDGEPFSNGKIIRAE